MPRVGIAYDVKGNGNQVVHVNYGQYSGRYDEAQIGANSPVGNPPDIEPVYQGPAGQGYNFAPGFNLANYPITSANAFVSDPTQNIKMDPNLKSPLTHEFTVSYGTKLFGNRGYGEVSYINRVTHDLIEDYFTLATGVTDVVVNGVSAGNFTNRLYQNAPNDQEYRKYQGLVFQSRFRINDHWTVNGQDTVQLQNYGNYEGEGTNTPGSTSIIGNYPEAFNAARSYPFGNLQNFERNRLRLWSIYTWQMGSKGDLSVSGLLRVESGLAYSIVAQKPAADRDADRRFSRRRAIRIRRALRTSSSPARVAIRTSLATASSTCRSTTTCRSSGRSSRGSSSMSTTCSTTRS